MMPQPRPLSINDLLQNRRLVLPVSVCHVSGMVSHAKVKSALISIELFGGVHVPPCPRHMAGDVWVVARKTR